MQCACHHLLLLYNSREASDGRWMGWYIKNTSKVVSISFYSNLTTQNGLVLIDQQGGRMDEKMDKQID